MGLLNGGIEEGNAVDITSTRVLGDCEDFVRRLQIVVPPTEGGEEAAPRPRPPP